MRASRRWILLTVCLLSVPSSATAALAPVGACVDVGMGVLAVDQLSFCGAFRLRVDAPQGAPWGLEYRHSVASDPRMTLTSGSGRGDLHVETLVIARETRRDVDRISYWLSLGLGVGRTSIWVSDDVDFLGQPAYRARPKLGLGLAFAVGVQFPGLFGPVGSRIAVHHQLVPVSDAYARTRSATHVTLGLVY